MSAPKESDPPEHGEFEADVVPDYAAMMKLSREEQEALTPEQAEAILFGKKKPDASKAKQPGESAR